MKEVYKSRSYIIGFTIITLFLVSLIYITNFVNAQNNDESLEINSNVPMIEYSDNINISIDISSINIPLPSATWNITNMELNFTDIKLGKEIITIEEEGDETKTVGFKGEYGYGVQINITVPTDIFGVYIYGVRSGEDPSIPAYIQIQGYNGAENIPDDNIYGTVPINMTNNFDWYIQTFENPISLSSGQYYLVMNGTEMNIPGDRTAYNWYYNDSGSINANLNTAKHDGAKWNWEAKGEPLLYKLIQRVDKSFDPEEINMSAIIDGIYYPILNGTEPETGQLNISKDISPLSEIYNIPIVNNRVSELLFNLSYHIKLQNILDTEWELLIKENLKNTWIMTQQFDRCYSNYSIKFIYPNNWYNLTIYRDIGFGWENITIDVIKDPINHFIFLQNNTIIEGSDWRITANSPNIQLPLNVQKTKFGAGQEIQFSVLSPIPPGNITFRLINSLGYPAQPDEVYIIDSIGTEDLILSYQLPSSPNEGIYKAYIFWNNATDAGVITQEFKVSIPFVLDPMLIVIIVSAVAILSIASFTTYKLVKISKRKHEVYRQSIFNKYMDVLNLDYLIITHKKSGLNIYEQIYAGKSIDASLIAGFLEAIRSFGIELTGASEQSQTIKLEYHDSKILMSEFKTFRILLIMKENPSHDFLESIRALSYDINKRYGNIIESFNGNITPLKGIGELLEQHLQTALIYPLEIIKRDIKLKSDEKSMASRAKVIMKKQNKDYFTVTSLLSIRKGFDAKEAETILNLIKKKVFQPKE
ncbi:MAG: hypothetical protein ACFFAQ_03055 [Promethearchaeota archaeon]